MEDKIISRLRDVKYNDYHFHWEKDEWYPNGSFRNIGAAVRNPMELLFQDYGAACFLGCPDFPIKNQWEFIGLCVNNEEEAYRTARPFFQRLVNEKRLQATLKGFSILYDMPGLDLSRTEDYEELSAKVKKAYSNGVFGRLPEAYAKSAIRKCQNIWTTRYAREHFDKLTEEERQLELKLLPATFRFDFFLVLPFRYQHEPAVAKWFREAIEDVGTMPIDFQQCRGMSATDAISKCFKSISFDDYLEYVDKTFEFFASRGARQLKSACCYARDLNFQERSEKDARAAFNKLKTDFIGTGKPVKDFEETIKIFEDFVFFRCIELAEKYDWNTLQIHTGHCPDESKGRPALLEELISKNPRIDFILLHGGKFNYREVLDLCYRYSNVSPDFTWIPILEPELAEGMVYEFIKEFPYRTMAGLDMANIEGSAGMAEINREIISISLSRLLAEGVIPSFEEAVRIGTSVIAGRAEKLFPGVFSV
jgi:predicted TIM-barrel fold metal-dependent hydrolase